MGYGTQRIEQELSELLPEASILRMDTDTTTSRYSYEEMLGTFRGHHADILLGTQMVTKGHDFPDVTLVGVLLAGASLYLDDYRAAERTFAMLTQVIGRAGRASKAGEAIIQTNNPDHECIRLACAQDYERFYDIEIRLRKALVFPPFCDIALLMLTSTDENELYKASTILSKKLTDLLQGEYTDVPVVTYGPFEAPVYKVENKYRMRMVIKCRLNRRSRAMFSHLLTDFSKSGAKGLSLSIDFNPSSL
jgi:primosomal protein N' (replication factor Y)